MIVDSIKVKVIEESFIEQHTSLTTSTRNRQIGNRRGGEGMKRELNGL
jgi:hypothetical protein